MVTIIGSSIVGILYQTVARFTSFRESAVTPGVTRTAPFTGGWSWMTA